MLLNFAWIISKWLSESSWPRFAISRMGLSSQQKGISLAIFQFGSVGAMWTKHCSNMSRVRVGSMTRCKSFMSTSRRSLGSTSELACTRTVPSCLGQCLPLSHGRNLTPFSHPATPIYTRSVIIDPTASVPWVTLLLLWRHSTDSVIATLLSIAACRCCWRCCVDDVGTV